MKELNTFLASIKTDFNLKVRTSTGYFTFSNSGRRDSVKEFSLGIPEVILMLKEILEHFSDFQNHSSYVEAEWRDLGATFFTDLVIKNACGRLKKAFALLHFRKAYLC